jgi:hypothetical protein
VSVDQFIGIIPGAIDDLGDEHNLSWGARSLLLWLATSACDRETGTAHHISINAIVDTTRLSWRAARRSLDELETAGAVSSYLPRGHEGTIEIDPEWYRRIVWAGMKAKRKRRSQFATSGRSRTSADGGASSNVEKAKEEWRRAEALRDRVIKAGIGSDVFAAGKRLNLHVLGGNGKVGIPPNAFMDPTFAAEVEELLKTATP